jgi:predicted unusual protein kinase regulating ubiquinone biosynthesis (AarF/ABC1/UbiB family)
MKIDETFFKKIGRLSTLSKTTTGLLSRTLASHFLDISIDHTSYASTLKEALSRMKGPIIKVVQFLSTIPDALPYEYATEFLTLQSDTIPFQGPLFVKKTLEKELTNLNFYFSNFDFKPVACASLGQVHKAQLKDSLDAVAVKIQYPYMKSIVDSDLSFLNILLSQYERIFKAIYTKEIQKELKDRLYEEIDYINEAKNMKHFQSILIEMNSRLRVSIEMPKVFEHASTDKVLTMSWMNGQPFSEFLKKNESQEARNDIARSLIVAFYYPLYQHCVLHSDSHPGNYLISQSDEGLSKGNYEKNYKNYTLQLLDFGCVRYFEKEVISGIIILYNALLKKKQEGISSKEEIAYAYRLIGFEKLNNDLIQTITLWAELLFEPLLDDSIRPIERSFSAKTGKQMALKIHKCLRAQGGITPPSAFLFIDRVTVTLAGVLMRLKAELNWCSLFREIIEPPDKCIS